ncbi:MAG: hypothetical protein ACXAC7_10700 [Candidatus Hodarchaeales archaeon]|jgi:hypothetical protein
MPKRKIQNKEGQSYCKYCKKKLEKEIERENGHHQDCFDKIDDFYKTIADSKKFQDKFLDNDNYRFYDVKTISSDSIPVDDDFYDDFHDDNNCTLNEEGYIIEVNQKFMEFED